ncbi:uncharacterized protein AB675_11643 [Cyphellophora attinorum]|uniref:Zn(2)-C6 fungal-type domain-containing protein n=1 Tax=Cyphellophora attinorum TaxID=1664694 RepID=A0A0N1GX64_9EURO|nr:uncharacterized protein AB675_11643 [Phialophora attinorum]KPI34655.1 hypothetical protein AB675_11643 [Phialophora attinorum]
MARFRRSKGCEGCRARRRRCDEASPSCGLCFKRGIHCVYGDQLNVVFVRCGPKPMPPRDASRDRHQTKSNESGASLPSVENVPQACLATAYRLQTHGNFLGVYLPQTSATATSATCTTAWLHSAYELSSTDQLLSDALSALSIQCLAHDGDLGAESQSQLLCGRVIRNLPKRLDARSQALGDTTLACVMVLNLLWSHRANREGASGWLFHAHGISALIHARGARNHSSDFGRELVSGSRLISLVGTIGKRKADWSQLPGGTIAPGDSRADFLLLFDILQGLPSTLEQLDTVSRLASEGNLKDAEAIARALIETCHVLTAQLKDWRDGLDTHCSDLGVTQLVSEEPSELYQSLPIDSPLRIFPTYFCYPNIDLAQQVLLYMVGNVFLWTVRAGMEDALDSMQPQRQTDVTPPLRPGEIFGAERACRMALQVAQSLEYFVRPGMGLAAIDIFGFPITFIYNWLTDRNVPERMWFEVIFGHLRTINSGYAAFLETATKLHGECDIFDLLR